MHPDQPSGAETKFVEMEGGRAAYTDEGSGPAVVCIHGMPASKRDFRWLEPALVPQLRVIRLDLPGFGETPRGAHQGADMDALAQFIWQFLDALQIETAALLGHSLGGAIATHAAADDRVKALVLISSAGPYSHRGHFPKTYRFFAPFSRHWSTRWLVIPLCRMAMELAGFRKGASNVTVATALQSAAYIDFKGHGETIRSLGKPTFVAWAQDDRVVEPKVSEALVELAPAGPRLRFDNGGHNIQKTRAAEIAEKLCPWIYEHVGLSVE